MFFFSLGGSIFCGYTDLKNVAYKMSKRLSACMVVAIYGI